MNILQQPTNGVLYPLTHPQKRIWYIEKIYPNTSLYNIGGPVRIKGPVDFALLEEAIALLLERHEGLRIKLVEKDGEASQYVSQNERVKLDLLDFSKYKDPHLEFRNWVEKEAQKPFVLDNERLFYFALFKISDNDNGYLVKFHHIISDGWSMNIVTKQICEAYMKLLSSEKIEVKAGHSYIEYLEHEQKYLQSERFLKNKLFWNEKFKVLPEALLNYSSDFIEGKRSTYEFDSQISSEIKAFAASNKCSLNTFFVLLYLLYLSKTSGQNEIVIGTPVLNRSGQKEKSMFGMFTSTMPFKFTLDDESTALEAIAMINNELMGCYYNQKYPYDLLIQDLELKKKGFDNLFNVCVNYYNTRLNTELNGYPIENVEFYSGNQLYSQQLVIKDWSDSGCLILDVDYKVNDYTKTQIDDMYIRLNNLISQIISNPQEKLGRLCLLSETEKKTQIYGFNATKSDYPKDKTIYQLFEQQAEMTPDKIAISFGGNELTYRELNCRANQLARFIAGKGVTRETVVGILTRHSIETAIGIFGIIKAGGAYLPIDPSYPDDRIGYMLEDSGAGILLVNYEISGSSCFEGEVINLNDTSIYTGEKTNLEVLNKPDDLVYVIYTSGSTGKPKGTMIEHQGLVNYIWWAKTMYVKDDNEVFPLYSSLAFDLTVTSIFTPLISGGRIIAYQDDGDEYVLYRIMKENKATVVKLTPSHLSLLKDMNNKASSVKRFIVGGEDLKVTLARSIHESFEGKIEIFNEYGPTETVVGCMIHKYNCENDLKASVPIGVPAHNVDIYILDKNLNSVPVNTAGEMYISGDGIARGYLNRSELTKERFIRNPFAEGKRMYRTGDLARLLSTGVMEYIGRADHQVKIRGYRIELGEIEKHLLNHDSIKDAVVIDRENENMNKYLCAYIVKSEEISSIELRNYLLGYLPEYMVPPYFIPLSEIPLNSNGKVNRILLPEPGKKQSEGQEFVSFRNEKEEKLVKVLGEILNIDKVSLTDNFYHLGGDSIKAIQIASRLKSAGFGIKVKDILSNPVIEKMILHIEQAGNNIADQKLCEGSIRPTPIDSWFFSQNFKNPNHFNQSVLLDLKVNIEVNELEMVMNELIEHHDALRINYDADKQELFYNNEACLKKSKIEVFNLADCSDMEQKAKISQIGEALKSGFDIQNGLLIKACIFDLGLYGRKLLLTAHHLVIDGVSWRIILEDILNMLENRSNGKGFSLPFKTCSVQDYANNLWNLGEEALKEQKYWESVIDGNFAIPLDFDLGQDTIADSDTITCEFTGEETEGVLLKANTAYGTEPKDLLITSLAMTIFDVFDMNEALIELEGHGREELTDKFDISRTAGWFTSMYPARLIKTCQGTVGLADQIKAIKEQLKKVPKKGIGFGTLKYLSKAISDKALQKRIRFNYLGDFDASFNNGLFSLSNEDCGEDCSKDNHLTSLIDINALVVGSKLGVSFKFSRNKFKEQTMEGFAKSYASNLRAIINHCCKKDDTEFTPSDFETIDISQDELDELIF